jgi:HEAT repeat protein
MRKTFGMNKQQKRVHKVGERRAGREQVEELLQKSRSDDPAERCEAAENLCPCHVRKRIEPVWEALYRMLEDPDVRVRRAAWHTLEDGGRPDDPALDAIVTRVEAKETDAAVLRLLRQVVGPREARARVFLRAAALDPKTRGKCDFCGRDDVPVDTDYRTTIGDGASARPAKICAACESSG